MPVLLQIVLLAAATHMGPSTLSKCGSHGREQIWLLWGWGGCCIWVTFVSLGHCLGPGHRAAFSWVLLDKGRCCGWVSTTPFLRAPCHQLTPELSWLSAEVPPSSPLLSHAAAQVRLVAAPAWALCQARHPPSLWRPPSVLLSVGSCPLLPLGHLLSTVSLVLPEPGREEEWGLTLGRAIKWMKGKKAFPSLPSCSCPMLYLFPWQESLLLSLSGATARTLVLIKLFKGKERKGRDIFSDKCSWQV